MTSHYECPGCGQTTDGSACRCTHPDPPRKPAAKRKPCQGHPAGPFDPIGITVYCDGTCHGRAARDFDSTDWDD